AAGRLGLELGDARLQPDALGLGLGDALAEMLAALLGALEPALDRGVLLGQAGQLRLEGVALGLRLGEVRAQRRGLGLGPRAGGGRWASARASASAAWSGGGAGSARWRRPSIGRGRSTIAPRPASSAKTVPLPPIRPAGAEKAARQRGASGPASGAASSGPGRAGNRCVRRPSSMTSIGGDRRSRWSACQRPE